MKHGESAAGYGLEYQGDHRPCDLRDHGGPKSRLFDPDVFFPRDFS